MKTVKTTFNKAVLILLLTSVALSSCSNDDDNNDIPNANQNNYYLTAKIDGVAFSRDFVTVSTLPDNTAFYTISGIGENSSIGLTLSSPTTVGTFTTGIGEQTALFYQNISPYIVWSASEGIGSGTITITENNATYMTGTFLFTGVNQIDSTTKVVTEGAFKAQKL